MGWFSKKEVVILPKPETFSVIVRDYKGAEITFENVNDLWGREELSLSGNPRLNGSFWVSERIAVFAPNKWDAAWKVGSKK